MLSSKWLSAFSTPITNRAYKALPQEWVSSHNVGALWKRACLNRWRVVAQTFSLRLIGAEPAKLTHKVRFPNRTDRLELS